MAKEFIMPVDSDGHSTLAIQILTMVLSQKMKNDKIPSHKAKLQSIRKLGNLIPDGTKIFGPDMSQSLVPRMCHVKNSKDYTLSLKEAKVKNLNDIMITDIPYIVCCIPSMEKLPISVSEENLNSQMRKYRVSTRADRTTKPNQHATWGAFLTTFHRDTMFSKKIHTLSPGSVKLWCFERYIGQLDLSEKETPEFQMAEMVAKPQNYDFFLQEPGEVIEHKGSYAHFVMTLNRHTSPYGQWSALVGWEINTPAQVHHSMQVDLPLIMGRDGTLKVATEAQFLAACSATTKLKVTALRNQKLVKSAFTSKQQRNSQEKVYKAARTKRSNQAKYAGLKYHAKSLDMHTDESTTE
jgi:hypothetical protein